MKSVLIAAAVVASAALATSAVAARKAPPTPASSPPISKDGIDISILPRIGAGGSAGVTEVGLDLEVKTLDAAARMGFQSLHAVTDVDCGRGANRFISAVAYQQPALRGAGTTRNITGEWVQPASDSYMAAVIARVCAAPAAAPDSHPPPIVKEMAAAPPPPAAAGLPAPASAPAAQVAAAPPAPTPTPPLVVKFNAGRPDASQPAAAPPTASPAPAATGPLVVKFSGAEPAASPPLATRRAGDRVAQVAASADLHDAEKVLRELKPLITAPLTTSIEQAVVGGAHVYRADVIGFETAADAKTFCKSAARWSKTCWVRARNDAPAKAAAKPPERLRPAKRAG